MIALSTEDRELNITPKRSALDSTTKSTVLGFQRRITGDLSALGALKEKKQ